MARIGIFSDTWLPNINGVVFSILNQIKTLQDEHELFLFVPKTHENKMEEIPKNVTVFEFPGLTFPSYPGYMMSYPNPKLGRIAKKYRFDILHSHSPFLQGWYCMTIRKIQKIPMVATFHTHLAEYAGHILKGFAEETVKHILYGVTWGAIKNQYNKYDMVFTPSKMMCRELEQHGVSPVLEMPNPISPVFLENLQNLDSMKQKFRRRFGIPESATLLIYVGRIAFEKRLEVLLEAYKELQKKNSNLFLAIVGDGPQLGMYKRKAEKLNLKNYVFTGYVMHNILPIVYQTGHVFISPSDTETQGLTFIEAMSQGCPVIAVKARGVVDYIKDKENGLFAENLDPKEFEELIAYAINSPNELDRIKRNAIKTAAQYNYINFKKRLLKGYKKAIDRWRERGSN
jgi:1,2-diacylglycerol 3-alpha-glucosyltransferase